MDIYYFFVPNNFYPRPPRGGRPDPQEKGALNGLISIHALREEGDSRTSWQRSFSAYFYPRPPRGGRLGHFGFLLFFFGISIHALREEGDTRC